MRIDQIEQNSFHPEKLDFPEKIALFNKSFSTSVKPENGIIGFTEIVVNGRKPAYWYRHGRNDKIQRDAFVNASLWIFDFVYYYLIIVRLATLSAASSPPDAYPLPGTGSRSTRFLSDDPTLHLFFSGIPGTRAGKHPVPACCGNPVKTVSQEMPEVLSEHIAYS